MIENFGSRTTSEQGTQNVLVVIDNCPDCLSLLQRLASQMPDLRQHYFTLLHACPTVYWEHGGDTSPEAVRMMRAIYDEEERELQLTHRYLEEAACILQLAGVSPTHIHLRTVVADSLLAATLAELSHGHYSSIILGNDHKDIENRLRGNGLFDRFRETPKVAFLTAERN